MPKPTIVLLCTPDAYFLNVLDPIRDQAHFVITDDLKKVEQEGAEATAVLSATVPGQKNMLKQAWPYLKNVKWVHSLSAGMDSLLFPELIDSDVTVTNARGVYKRSLAEFAVLGVLYFYKRVRRLVDSQRAHQWDQFFVESMDGRTMGIVGYGEIGRECALLAHGLGMRIVACRRRPEKNGEDAILDKAYPLDALNEMLAECDVVTAAAPLTKDTKHMLGDAQFRAMKSSAILINVGRGPVVDERALIAALQEKRIAGAALDVFEQEPLPSDHVFFDMENVLLSPHCTDRTEKPDWLETSMQRFVDNFQLFVKGQPLEHVVDKHAGY